MKRFTEFLYVCALALFLYCVWTVAQMHRGHASDRYPAIVYTAPEVVITAKAHKKKNPPLVAPEKSSCSCQCTAPAKVEVKPEPMDAPVELEPDEDSSTPLEVRLQERENVRSLLNVEENDDEASGD